MKLRTMVLESFPITLKKDENSATNVCNYHKTQVSRLHVQNF